MKLIEQIVINLQIVDMMQNLSSKNTKKKIDLDYRLDIQLIEKTGNQQILSSKKDRLYTTEDVDDFAEWTAFMQWIYDPIDKCWFQKHSSETKTTAQLRELWEKEMRKKED